MTSSVVSAADGHVVAASAPQVQALRREVAALRAEVGRESVARQEGDGVILSTVSQLRRNFGAEACSGARGNVFSAAEASEVSRAEARTREAAEAEAQVRALQADFRQTLLLEREAMREAQRNALDAEGRDRLIGDEALSLELRCTEDRLRCTFEDLIARHADVVRQQQEGMAQQFAPIRIEVAQLSETVARDLARLRADSEATRARLDEDDSDREYQERRRDRLSLGQELGKLAEEQEVLQKELLCRDERRAEEYKSCLTKAIGAVDHKVEHLAASLAVDALAELGKTLRQECTQLLETARAEMEVSFQLRAEALRSEVSALRSEMALASEITENAFADVAKSQVQQAHRSQRSQREEASRESGNAGVLERVDSLQQTVKDTLAQHGVELDALQLDLQGALESLHRVLETESVRRAERDTSISARLQALEDQKGTGEPCSQPSAELARVGAVSPPRSPILNGRPLTPGVREKRSQSLERSPCVEAPRCVSPTLSRRLGSNCGSTSGSVVRRPPPAFSPCRDRVGGPALSRRGCRPWVTSSAGVPPTLALASTVESSAGVVSGVASTGGLV